MSYFVDDSLSGICWFQGQHTDYDFKGGAGSTSVNKQSNHKNEITSVDEHSPEAKLEDNLSDDGNKDLIIGTPVRHSARTAGKQFKYWPCHFIALNYFCHKDVGIHIYTYILY